MKLPILRIILQILNQKGVHATSTSSFGRALGGYVIGINKKSLFVNIIAFVKLSKSSVVRIEDNKVCLCMCLRYICSVIFGKRILKTSKILCPRTLAKTLLLFEIIMLEFETNY